MSSDERKSHLEDGELDDEEEENVEMPETAAADSIVNVQSAVRAPSPVEIEMASTERPSSSPPVLDVGPALVVSPDPIVMVVPAIPQPSFTSIYDQYDDEDDDDDDDYGLGRKRLKIDESDEPVVSQVNASPAQEEAEKASEVPAGEPGTSSGQLASDTTSGIASMSSTLTGQIDIKLDRASVGMTVIDALVDPSTVISSVSSKLSEPDAKTASSVVLRSELENDNESSSSSAVSAISAISSASLPTSEVSNDTKNVPVNEEKMSANQEVVSKEASSPVVTTETTAPQPNADISASVAVTEPLDIEPDTGDMSNAAVISGDTVSSVNSFKSFEETSDKAKGDEPSLQEPSKPEETTESKPAPPEPPATGALKVPPLKIICSNATGMAYVKTASEIEGEK